MDKKRNSAMKGPQESTLLKLWDSLQQFSQYEHFSSMGELENFKIYKGNGFSERNL